ERMEGEGVGGWRRAVDAADLVLLVEDRSQPRTASRAWTAPASPSLPVGPAGGEATAAFVPSVLLVPPPSSRQEHKVLCVANKSDLAPAWTHGRALAVLAVTHQAIDHSPPRTPPQPPPTPP